MSKKHEEILKALSPEAVRALVNTREWSAVALPRGPLREVVRRELTDAGLAAPITMAATAVRLTVPGECVRHYAMIKMLEDLG